MSSRPESPPPAHDDWLDGCVGFVVESSAGKIGRVAEVERDAESGRPVALVVRAGMAGIRRLLLSADDVAAVLPSSRRIVLNGPPAPMTDAQPAASPAR